MSHDRSGGAGKKAKSQLITPSPLGGGEAGREERGKKRKP